MYDMSVRQKEFLGYRIYDLNMYNMIVNPNVVYVFQAQQKKMSSLNGSE